jgi:FMN phosphatase YigB (HAD superfamily)
MPTVIFDLNRTLYDPETNGLLPGVHDLLETLQANSVEMHVISRKEPGREDILKAHGVEHYFGSITFVDDKTHELFADYVSSLHGPVYVVGDYLHEEIRFGVQAKAKTIWLKRGKFSHLLPESEDDTPWKIVSELDEVAHLILDSKP